VIALNPVYGSNATRTPITLEKQNGTESAVKAPTTPNTAGLGYYMEAKMIVKTYAA